MKHKYLLLALPIATALSACGAKPQTAEPVLVQLTEATVFNGSANFYSGSIEAQRTIPLSFLTLGTVAEVNVREGQQVKKGELLAKLDCQTNESALRMAEAKSKQADDAFRRFEPMYKNGNLPEIKMVEIETGRTQAALALKMAAKYADDCSITAPESGIISDRSVEPGSSAIPAKAALKLVTVDQVYAAISVPEAEISKIRPGMRAEVEITALRENRPPNTPDGGNITLPLNRESGGRDGKFRGIVADSGVAANPLARTYTVRVLLNNPMRRILPGMLCGVYVGGATRPGLILVPAAAVTRDENGAEFVYIASTDGKKVNKNIVRTAGFAAGGILISEGLHPGERVVSAGVQKLSDGAAITTKAI